ncbi:hypothetical protein ABTN45_19555, partial [Acinetobacter baumannii]
DLRGNFAVSNAKLATFLISGNVADKDQFEQPFKRYAEAVQRVQTASELLTVEQKASFDSILAAGRQYAELPERMIAIRQSEKWNRPAY